MKKSYLYLLFIFALTLSSCGGGGDESETIEPDVNTAPTIPNQIFPLDNTICTDNNVVFEWSASTDAEANIITYRLEVSENKSFSPLTNTDTSFSESKLITLDKGKAYFWRIKAIDSRNAESDYSSVMQFVTEGEGVLNHIPFAPALVAPTLNSEIDSTSVVLTWSASDVDGDPLSYDVYLDTDENPTTLISENQSETSYNATDLPASTKYYFKILVKDDKGASSIGQIWSFSTK